MQNTELWPLSQFAKAAFYDWHSLQSAGKIFVKNTEFFDLYSDVLDKWVRYLVEYGMDPANQLCTDDFAGHLAHNCNLSLKAIMGMVGFADILTNLDRAEEAAALLEKAKEYIAFVLENAKNEDGSYRLAYDRPGSFSLKYNAV